MSKINSKRKWFIYFAAFSCNLIALATGTCYSWTSPYLKIFSSIDPTINPIGRPATTSESAWIVSLMTLGLVIGPTTSILFGQCLSKKKILLLFGIPLFLSHVLCIFANNIYYFFVARFLMGVATGNIWNILPSYLAEIAEDKNRGFLGGLGGVMSCVGTLLSYIIGPFVSIVTFSLINLIPISLFFILFGYFVPESPYDLIINNRNITAKECLKKLRGHSKVDQEIGSVTKFLDSNTQATNRNGFILDLFTDKGLFKALKICVCLMMFQQMSGIVAVLAYTQTIFDASGSILKSEYAAIIIGTTSLTSNILSSSLIDRLGRKMLLMTSCIIVFISLFVLGFYFYFLQMDYNLTSITSLPLISLIIFIFGYALGLLILPWVIVGEIFPIRIKILASTICVTVNFGISFAVTILFPYLVNLVGMSGTFMIFATLMVLATLFCLFFLPETKGKSFAEIEQILMKK